MRIPCVTAVLMTQDSRTFHQGRYAGAAGSFNRPSWRTSIPSGLFTNRSGRPPTVRFPALLLHLMRAPLLFPLLLTCCTGNAQYSGPESVEYDAVGDRYFVSNTGSSLIKVRSQAGVVTDFVSVSPAPYGLEIKGDTLFACSGGSVKGYLLSNATQVFNL